MKPHDPEQHIPSAYPLPGTSTSSYVRKSHPEWFEASEALVKPLPDDARRVITALEENDWEWTLHWYLSWWGGPTATIAGWLYGSMMVMQWRAPHEGDALILVDSIFKPMDEIHFSSHELEAMIYLVETA